jgi:conjugal transfer/entry exclusion protein
MILETINDEKLQKVSDQFDLYTRSLSDIDKTLDAKYPISVNSMSARSENVHKVRVPWKSVLSEELGEGQLDYDKLSGLNQSSDFLG